MPRAIHPEIYIILHFTRISKKMRKISSSLGNFLLYKCYGTGHVLYFKKELHLPKKKNLKNSS